MRIVKRAVSDADPGQRQRHDTILAVGSEPLLERLGRALPDVPEDELRFRMEATAGILAFLAGGHPGIDLETNTESDSSASSSPSSLARSPAAARRPRRRAQGQVDSHAAAPREASCRPPDLLDRCAQNRAQPRTRVEIQRICRLERGPAHTPSSPTASSAKTVITND